MNKNFSYYVADGMTTNVRGGIEMKNEVNNNRPEVSNLDMGPIYRKVLLTLGEGNVSSFVIFDNQPYDLTHFSLPNGNSLIHLNKCKNMVDKIIGEIHNGKCGKNAPKFAIHSLNNEEVGLLYTLSILISEMLDIPCPQVGFQDYLEVYGRCIAERNHVILCTNPNYSVLSMFVPLAHELRHLWQHKNHPEFFGNYISYKDSLDGYFNSLAELDAQAFAFKLELAVFGECSLDPKEYAMGNVEVKRKTVELMDSIVLDEGYIYILKGLLGY